MSEDTEDDLAEVDEEEAKALTAEVEPATAEVEVRVSKEPAGEGRGVKNLSVC